MGEMDALVDYDMADIQLVHKSAGLVSTSHKLTKAVYESLLEKTSLGFFSIWAYVWYLAFCSIWPFFSIW